MATLSPPRAAPAPDVGSAALTALIVGADPERLDFLDDNLGADRFTVMRARSGEDALAMMTFTRPAVAVIEVALPGMSGFDLVSAIREGRTTAAWDPAMAIILTCGGDDPYGVVRGLERGADDVLVTPVRYPELLARIGAQVRRAHGVSLVGSLRVGPLEVDRRSLTALLHGRTVPLSAKEFGLLALLARDPLRAVSKDEILKEVWGYSHPARTRTVDTHASRVRGKLASAGQPGWIRNVWGHGYRLLPEERV